MQVFIKLIGHITTKVFEGLSGHLKVACNVFYSTYRQQVASFHVIISHQIFPLETRLGNQQCAASEMKRESSQTVEGKSDELSALRVLHHAY